MIESVPIFPGCEGNSNEVLRQCFITNLHKHVQKHFRYPETAKELGLTELVYVIFYIDTDGFIKVIADADSDEILGVHMIGPRCADLISEAVVAMEYKASAEDIARITHAHPTFSEAIKEAALDATEKRALHF